ncbi:MAG TPA: putative collagen-binding domain-containing protein [Polyangiaceae bacterium]|nr:putative collagen-binding domain-containing protein [Polyangiaceae bacterium]
MVVLVLGAEAIFACAPAPDPSPTSSSVSEVSGSLTIGETAVLNVGDNENGNLLIAQSAALSEPATIQSLSFYVTTAAGKLRLGIYDASGPGAGPGKKLAETAEMSAVSGWNTASVPPTPLSAGSYWLAYLPSDNGLGFVKVPGNSNSKFYGYAFGPLPTTFSTNPQTSGSHWSLYATLTTNSTAPNQAPTIATPAAATLRDARTAQLSVLGADDGGEAALTYTWSVSGTPPAPVSFSVNGNNAAKSSNVSFNKAGSYTFLVTVRDASGATAQSSVSISVGSAVTTVSVTPSTATVSPNATKQFTASMTDQFGSTMAAPPPSTWSTSGGSIAQDGLYTAGASSGGPYVVKVSSGGVDGTANVTVAAAATTTVVIGETNVLTTADSGNGNLLVAQSAALTQPASLRSLSFYVTQAAGKLRLGLYDASGPSGAPGRKLAETPELSPVSGWNTGSVSPIDLPAGSYWLAYFASDNQLGFVKSPGNSNSKSISQPYGVMPATFATNPSSSGSHWSLYATLDAQGAPASDPCAGVSCASPPAAVCQSTSVRRSYSLPGTCNNGSCSYAPVDQTCPGQCQNGVCVSSVSNGLPGPLTHSPNPNYFQDTTGRAVALFGSHTWNDFQDWGTNGSPQPFDFAAYTQFLVAHGHNFTFLWRTELPKFCSLPTQSSNSPDITTNTQPWLRSGPGNASDGGPRFDLTQFDQSYFDRLRSRVDQLNRAGIWVGVYLFTGEWLNAFRCPSDGYPFTGGNNINGIDDGGGNGSMTMSAPNAITNFQDALIDRMIDTLNDLPNVIWVVSEEANANTQWWQAHVISHVRAHESSKPYQHPVGLGTLEYGTPDSRVIDTDADWIAPMARLSPSSTCGSGSPACKVNINDSDHSYFSMWNDSKQVNRQYAWQNFVRGNQVAFMDPYELYYPRESRNLCPSPSNGICTGVDPRWDNFRDNLGYLVSYSRRLNLAAAHAQDALCSTSYCLGQTPAVGTELLVYAPNGGGFSVNLSSAAGRTLNYEWFDPDSGRVISTGSVAGGNPNQGFGTPASIPGDSVLYLVDSAGHG